MIWTLKNASYQNIYCYSFCLCCTTTYSVLDIFSDFLFFFSELNSWVLLLIFKKANTVHNNIPMFALIFLAFIHSFHLLPLCQTTHKTNQQTTTTPETDPQQIEYQLNWTEKKLTNEVMNLFFVFVFVLFNTKMVLFAWVNVILWRKNRKSKLLVNSMRK